MVVVGAEGASVLGAGVVGVGGRIARVGEASDDEAVVAVVVVKEARA